MNILCHGYPFCCDATPLARYQGPHTIRSLGVMPNADYPYMPAQESLPDILARIRRDWQPDLIIFWTPEMYPPPPYTESADIPTVACISDWNIYYPRLAVNLARYDLVLCDRAGVEIFAGLGLPAHFGMPLYSHISTTHRATGVERDIDVLFLGSLNPAAHVKRTRLLERIAAMDSKYRILIGGNLPPESYAEYMSRARIVFNHSIRGELNLRAFETMACGAMPLIERDNNEVRDYFEEGLDVVLYDESDLEQVLERYLEAPHEAARIAANAHRQSDAWAGENRFDALIEYCVRNLGKRSFASYDIPVQHFHTWLQYAGARDVAFHEYEDRLAHAFFETYGEGPRSFTAIGQGVLRDEGPSQRACHAYYEAYRQARHAAPFALNAASMFRAAGRTSMEQRCLEACLNADSLEGADLLAGTLNSAFYSRWLRDCAANQHTLHQMHAEAHIRLATIATGSGRLDEAEEHLGFAQDLDPENHGGDDLWAELLWASGRKNAAIDFLMQNQAYHPFDRRMYTRLESMHREVGAIDEAEQCAERAARIFGRILSSRSEESVR